jgi:hypothetical protein
MTLTDFLLTRIAEDEAGAKAAQRRVSAWTEAEGPWVTARRIAEHVGRGAVLDAFIARHDPARALAECETKRAIVELHRGGHECVGVGQTWWSDEESWTEPCPTLRSLTLPYSDHPDHADEWRV